jgi:hypothetical protein
MSSMTAPQTGGAPETAFVVENRSNHMSTNPRPVHGNKSATETGPIRTGGSKDTAGPIVFAADPPSRPGGI